MKIPATTVCLHLGSLPFLCWYLNRRALQRYIDQEYEAQRNALKDMLRTTQFVSVTMDIWSDQMMRGFLGLTVHFLQKDVLITRVLDVPRFKGKSDNA